MTYNKTTKHFKEFNPYENIKAINIVTLISEVDKALILDWDIYGDLRAKILDFLYESKFLTIFEIYRKCYTVLKVIGCFVVVIKSMKYSITLHTFGFTTCYLLQPIMLLEFFQ